MKKCILMCLVAGMIVIGTGPAGAKPDTERSVSTTQAISINERLVRRVYPLVLRREADPEGVAYWTARLDAGFNPYYLGARLADSGEGRRALVRSYYDAVLERSPDPSGLTFWTNRLGAGTTAESMRTSLLTSSEAWMNGGGTSAGFVQKVYEVNLRRAARSSDVDYWVGRLGSNPSEAARRRVALTIGRSTESQLVNPKTAYLEACGSWPDGSSYAETWAAWMSWDQHPFYTASFAYVALCPPTEAPA